MTILRRFLVISTCLFLFFQPLSVYSQILKRTNVKVDPKSGLVTDAPYQVKDYAPYYWYSYYEYEGQGNEYASYWVKRTHSEDSKGRYQYVLASGAHVAHVLQLQKEQIAERAYFPLEDENQVPDYRYSEDANDLFGFTVLPANLQPGTKFYHGYRRTQPFQVIGILQLFNVLDRDFYDVLLVESIGPGPIQRYYYAPRIGLIQSEYFDGDFVVISRLKDFY